MARVSHIQNAFTAGEISPRLYGRTDLQKYNSALATCRNFVLMPHGGVTTRSGTRFIAQAKYAAKKSRMVEFEFSTTQAYILEFGDLYMRVFKDYGQVQMSCHAYEVVTPYTEADLPYLSWCQSADVLFLVCPGHPPRTLSRTGHTAWTLASIAFVDGPYCDENTDSSITITPSGTGSYVNNGAFAFDLAGWDNKSVGAVSKIQWDASGYMLLIGNGSDVSWGQQTVTLPATGTYSLSFEVVAGPVLLRIGTTDGGTEIANDVSYDTGVHEFPVNFTATTVYLGFKHTSNASRAVDNVAITNNASITLTASSDLFQAGHVGASWRLTHGATTGWVKITAYASATQVTAEVQDPLGSTAATSQWREGAWSGVRGYPRAVTWHQGRLIFGGSELEPQRLWGSKVGNYLDMTPDTVADSAITADADSNEVNSLAWIVSGRVLQFGSVGGEWRIGSADSDSAITPSNIAARQESANGSRLGVKPVKVGGSTMYVQRAGTKVREMAYDYQSGGWVSSDLTLLAEHITQGLVKEMAYAQEPDSIVWMVLEDGGLVGLTFNRAEQVVGWHRHDTDGEFESVAVIHGGGTEQVWVVVKRTINGVDKRYIEVLEPTFGSATAQEDAFLVDSGLTYDGTPATTFTGLDHLEGKTVNILADGAVAASKVVTSGTVTISKAASTVHVGLPITYELQTLRMEAGGDDGTAQGHKKKISKVVLRLWRSLGGKVSTDGVNWSTLIFRTSADKLGSPPALYTGDKDVILDPRWDREGQLWIKQDQPLPFTCLALVAQVTTNSL